MMLDHAQADPLLLWTIDKLEQSKVVLRAERSEEAHLLEKIDEAIAAGQQLLRSRNHICAPASNVVPLRAVRRAS